jgi:hypothetical protein
LFVFALASLLQLLFGESKMNKLSQSAQAVLDAFGTYPLRADHIDEDLVPALAAALCAAADQVVPDKPAPDVASLKEFERWDAKRFVRLQFLAIAAELDGATTASENV